uniref:Integrase catalytic domain-containing protein n=1 Tax=Strongyloides papillosus TaxID=174720 RepID=A0A0N5B4Z1_STREA
MIKNFVYIPKCQKSFLCVIETNCQERYIDLIESIYSLPEQVSYVNRNSNALADILSRLFENKPECNLTEKRKRGKPRKHPLPPTSIQNDPYALKPLLLKSLQENDHELQQAFSNFEKYEGYHLIKNSDDIICVEKNNELILVISKNEETINKLLMEAHTYNRHYDKERTTNFLNKKISHEEFK